MRIIHDGTDSLGDVELRARTVSGHDGRAVMRDCRLGSGGPSYRVVLVPLMRHDPIHINYGEGPEVYLPDSETISARLRACGNEAEVCRVVYEELSKSFGTSAAGSRETYTQIGREIWQRWHALT